MKQIGFFLFCALVAFAVYVSADTNDFCVTAIAIEGNDVRVTWQCTGPSNYLLQVSSTVTGAWTGVLGSLVHVTPSTLTTTNFVDPGGATNFPAGFYRVKVSKPS
jgi:hypothetical protein